MENIELLKTIGEITIARCEDGCENCEFDSNNTKCEKNLCNIDNFKDNAEEIIEICEQWRKDNPRKTYADMFFEQFPNADYTTYNGVKVPTVTFKRLYGGGYIDMETDMKSWLQPYQEAKK